MRLIDADGFKESLDDIKIIIDEDVLKCESVHEQLVYLLNKVEDAIKAKIDDAPTIEAVPVVHGKWISDLDANGKLKSVWRGCSVCGCLNHSTKPNYCPNCGAKMTK